MKRLLALLLVFPLQGCIDQAQADTPIAIASVSKGELCYKLDCWEIQGSPHTPRGTYQIEQARSGLEMGFSDPTMIVLPFLTIDASEIPPDNPMYDPDDKRPLAFAIHENNLKPGEIGAGCLLVDRSLMPELRNALEGATLEIRD